MLGGELVTNGDFASDTAWTKDAGWTITGGAAVATSAGVLTSIRQNITTVSGRLYRLEYTCSSYTVGLFSSRVGGSIYETTTSGTGVRTTLFVATSSSTEIAIIQRPGLAPNDVLTAAFDSVSVKELPGNHALAPNDASRPVLRSRYNQLTYSEQFDNAAWTKGGATVSANSTVAPDGTTTADKLVENTAAAEHLVISANTNIGLTNAVLTSSVYVKAAERTSVHVRAYSGGSPIAQAFFNTLTQTFSGIVGGTWSFENAGNGWYRIQVVATHPNASGNGIGVFLVSGTTTLFYTGDGTSGIYIWGAQLLSAADQSATGGAYQRIAAATDYDTSNPVWRPYLAFDGSDDSMSTSSIDFSGTDEVTVFAGVTKLSDAARATLAELGNNVTSSFRLEAPNAATPTYQFGSAGTNLVGTTTSSVYPAPTTNVLTGIGDISADVSTLRVNGAQASSNTADQGTGNYGNLSLFVGRRNNASQPFNGRLTSLIVLGRTATAAEISATESWVNGKTGAY